MNALLGQQVKVSIELEDGRLFDLDGAVCASVEISSLVDTIEMTDNKDEYRVYAPGKASFEMTARFITPIAPKMSLSDSYNGKGTSYCMYCYSDWTPGPRGNCGACGAPRKAAKIYDDAE